jgi:5-methylthioadenosine/S-adenosylhomocysteine deaminase
MNKKLIIPKCIITANKNDDIFRDRAVEIEDGIIKTFYNIDKNLVESFEGEIFEYPNFVLIPGFVQTHVHMCQTLFRGLADDLELLDWLQKKIFPFENAHSKDSVRASVKLSILDFQTGGTTTILDMGTINHQEILFEEFIKSKERGYSGKCMMDENNLYSEFKENRNDCVKQSGELAAAFHNSAEGRIKYAFAPRFVLSCSEQLMKETKELLDQFPGSLYHTHSSENRNEIEEVYKKYGMENIEYFNSIGVLSDRTVLAHCIHVNENEKQFLKETQTRVAHCPSANLKLGSGIANIPGYLKNDISVSLGADGAPCNNNLSMFTEMKHAALIQKPIHGSTAMDSKTVFRLATIDGAKALHLDDEIGSIEAGKKADIVLLDLEKPDQCLLDEDKYLYSNIVYSSNKQNVNCVMVNGEWVVVNGESVLYDKQELYENGKHELNKLLSRI